MTTPNLWDAAKTVLKGGNLLQYNPTSRNKKNIRDDLTLHVKQMGKEGKKN